MVILQAPALHIETTSFLPNPEFSDSRGLKVELRHRRAMDGTLYSTVSTTGAEVLELTFFLTRVKALEIEDFYRFYSTELIRLTNYTGLIYVGHFLEDIETEAVARGEYQNLKLKFEGVKQ